MYVRYHAHKNDVSNKTFTNEEIQKKVLEMTIQSLGNYKKIKFMHENGINPARNMKGR